MISKINEAFAKNEMEFEQERGKVLKIEEEG